ncbi:dolichyl-phosphate-mannose-protein mannosyltransferase [Tenacibaculum adriaticum]|uniref:Dolichyl-phosphate-mannose-protein mannosyltransferase n=1 Tax=Tenacibaculum adriaticum TaxID=413713 RepID=A0A5S5DUF1_9FLAO|nr:glycosyltransferase family 39 protein [Tenacibaculum adriaticum]TYP98249.1 dolichyl-phosphate-mannose-protein mannosyltransferase [Tenacibaculum adriaticum]
MKIIQNANKLLIIFLIILFVVNIIQGYTTDLIADEAYYWVYSNFLDWGYFDHPPMVAVWITISKLFFSSGELSVRFFSAITLSVTFYLVWFLIQHPKKKEYTWLFILIVLTTSLFNVYGFITVPDAPLLFFMAIFLIGYQKYLKDKSLLSYSVLALSMAGMMYSKYQAALIIIFVILSNLKLLKDYKLWITTLVAILLFSPHLYWQYANDYPSFKYHLLERKENSIYHFRYTYMHFINMIAIIGFTFPIVYKALFKNLKTKDYFQRALNFIVMGFIIFFFISSFKGSTQAQWVVPISISLIIIPFNYLIENPRSRKSFLWLAGVTLVITTFLRFAMANDGMLPRQFDMHGNKKWVAKLDKKLDGKKPLFLNSYQNTSIYWFYSGKKSYQYNSWSSRKNQYDLLDYNNGFAFDEMIKIEYSKERYTTDSLIKRNKGKLFLSKIKNYKKENILLEIVETPIIKKNQLNHFKVVVQNPNHIDLNTVDFYIILKDKNKITLKTADKNDNPRKAEAIKAELFNGSINFLLPNFENKFTPEFIQIIGKANKETKPVRMSSIVNCNFKNE